MKHGIIYVHVNKITGMKYVGQTWTGMKRRWHSGYSRNPYFNRTIKKYGKASFETVVLCSATTQEDLNFLEEHFIKLFDCLAPNGYNIKIVCDGRPMQAEETKEKIRQKAIGRKTYPKITYPIVDVDGVLHKTCGTCKKFLPLETSFQKIKPKTVNRTCWQHWCKVCREDYRKRKRPYIAVPEDVKQENFKIRGEKFKAIHGTPEKREFYRQLHAQPIERLDPSGNVVASYLVAKDANAEGFLSPGISNAIKTGKLYRGFLWRKKV